MKIIAHRGASNISPENTIASVKLAIEMGADGVEVDIHKTKDDKLVVIHDDSLIRTVGKDILISDSNYDEIKNFDIGSWFDKKYANEKIPLLKDILQIIPPDKTLFIEIKSSLKVKLLTDEIKSYCNDMDHIIIISFDLKILQDIKAIESALKVLWIPHEYSESVKKLPKAEELKSAMKEIMLDGLAFDSRLEVSEEEIEDIRSIGLKLLYSWTVNDLDRAEVFFKLKLDGIETDTLKLFLEGSYRERLWL